jgi:serine/threonine protein kinase
VSLEPEESLPRLLSGRYRLEAKLGHGGMGVVYRATDRTMKRQVAVKLIRATDGVELDEEVAGRFLREAKNTARIQHEHIIEVYDLGRSETNDLYMVMELLEGESLSVRLRREGRLSPQATVHIGRQICEALEVAHEAGIIHRDLKPANVMLVSRAGDDAFVKVLDFGVAKSYAPDQETQLTHTGMLVGTVEYMAPEQIMGKVVDGRTDIYSLGIVLYRMLLGKPPFKDGGVPAMIHHHLNVMPKPLREQGVTEVPGALDRVILRCLAKKPEQRYETMSELSRALAAAMEPEDLGLASLEYSGDANDDDPYAIGDKTEVARPSDPLLHAQREAALESLPSLGDSDSGISEPGFEDATVKMDRPLRPSPNAVPVAGAQKGPAPPRPAAGQPAPSMQDRARAHAQAQDPMLPQVDETELLANREDLSTAKRAIPADLRVSSGREKKICAMCQTANAPHVRACVACGVSLAAEDQDAVRARVTAPSKPPPRTAHLAAPQMPPPTSGAYPAPAPLPHSPMHGIPPALADARHPRRAAAATASAQFSAVDPAHGAASASGAAVDVGTLPQVRRLEEQPLTLEEDSPQSHRGHGEHREVIFGFAFCERVDDARSTHAQIFLCALCPL